MPLTQPPRDPAGKAIAHDHPQIPNESGIIRRVSYQQLVTGADGRQKISSMAYQASGSPGEGMSVDIEVSILDAGLDPKMHVITPRWIGSVRFSAGQLRNEGLQVGFDPITDGPDTNPHHGQAWGDFPRGKRKRLANLATWFVVIPNVDLV